MTEQHEILDTPTAADRTLVLIGEHLQAVLDNPDILETIPNGATLALIPDDDPALARHNLDLALQLFAGGRNVYLYHHIRPTAAAQPVATSGERWQRSSD